MRMGGVCGNIGRVSTERRGVGLAGSCGQGGGGKDGREGGGVAVTTSADGTSRRVDDFNWRAQQCRKGG